MRLGHLYRDAPGAHPIHSRLSRAIAAESLSTSELEDGFDVVRLAYIGIGPPVDGHLASDETGEPVGVGLASALAASS